MTAGFTLAHFSDTHLGYEAYPEVSANGNNQRAEDVVRAFATVVSDIVASDPPLVIHSGDVADHPRVANRIMLFLMGELSRLAAIRPDGTRRQVVIVAGNHELPRDRKEACFLELYRNMAGVHVVTLAPTRVTFDSTADGSDPCLDDVVVHAVPHDALKDLASSVTASFDDIAPLPGKVNILATHGVAGGSELYVRSLGREFAVPTDVLARDWDYGALGHWHRRGPVHIVRNDTSSKIWYAGSTENMGFSDLLENSSTRGWLSVKVNPGELPEVTPRDVANRAMFRLPVLDATDMDPSTISTELVERVNTARAGGTFDGAIVAQVVTGVSRDVWSLVDLTAVRAAASPALHFEVAPRYSSLRDAEDDTTARSPLGDLADALAESAAAVVSDRLRAPALEMARELLADTLAALPTGSADQPAGTTEQSDSDSAGDQSSPPTVSSAGELQPAEGSGADGAERELDEVSAS